MFDFTGKTLVALITLTCSVSFMLFGWVPHLSKKKAENAARRARRSIWSVRLQLPPGHLGSTASWKPIHAMARITANIAIRYDQGVLSGLIGANNQFGVDFNHPDANTQGLIVSVYQLGNVAGSIGIFFLGDWLGRRNSILLSSVIMLIGAILQTASVNRGMMYAARIITGIVSIRRRHLLRIMPTYIGKWRKYVYCSGVAGGDQHGQRAREARSDRHISRSLRDLHCVLVGRVTR
jgi:hypothetical protein